MRVQRAGFRTEDGGREGWEGWPVKIQESEVIAEGEMGGFGSSPGEEVTLALQGNLSHAPRQRAAVGRSSQGKEGVTSEVGGKVIYTVRATKGGEGMSAEQPG